MLNVLLSFDTEVWCGGWDDLDAKFPNAFKKYFYGKTRKGDYGLPFILDVLDANGLQAVFFVEPLFATRFGMAPLEEIVGLVTEAGQAVEMHLHTEWVDEAIEPIIPGVNQKRQHIHYFTYEEQCQLLATASRLLRDAGASALHAYRAGSFGANNDTLRALASTNIGIDSSFNPTAPACAIEVAKPLRQPTMLEGVLEVPTTIFRDGLGKLRPAQLTACSFQECKAALHAALRARWDLFTILSHPFELLNDGMTRGNWIVIRRFTRLCEYLAANRDRFRVTDFSSRKVAPYAGEAAQLNCGSVRTIGRVAEQALSTLI